MGLGELVDEYLEQDAPRRDAEASWWSDSNLSVPEAISRAALSVLPNEHGRRVMHSHQRRPGAKKLKAVEAALLPIADRIGKAPDFDALITILEDAVGAMPGVGELIIYDVAERIGHKLQLAPRKVYLHSGARHGAAKLKPEYRRRATLEMHELPEELRRLTPSQVEDFLCLFKDRLDGGGADRRKGCGPSLASARRARVC